MKHTPFDDLDVALIPGPPNLAEPISSLSLEHVVNYTPQVVSDAFLSIEGSRVLHAASPTWWEWRAEWADVGGSLKLGMTLFDVDPPLWGGSEIEVACTPQALLTFWLSVRKHCPAVYLHDTSCMVYTPEYFESVYLT